MTKRGEADEPSGSSADNALGLWMSLGMAFGIPLGMLADNVGLGLALGLGFGVAIGVAKRRTQQQRDEAPGEDA
ncbi:hypothetical protein [Streptomyces sp. NPDC048825]|uniref:hypothetical protein n=1 Tax=Streptomyces sp. NPDC048825 TaxID=3365592 RepID=UPI00371FABE8